jgi:hypothetical protein
MGSLNDLAMVRLHCAFGAGRSVYCVDSGGKAKMKGITMSESLDREQAYWDSLPRCVWCADALPEAQRAECDRCGRDACIDHCATALSGEMVCLGCKGREYRDIRKMANSEPLGDLLEIA